MLHGKVLVVEDDPMLRMDATLLFEEAGFDVAEFECADDALAYVWDYTNEVAAIFTDVEMLGSASGFDLASTVTTAWPHIAVLVTSGFHEEVPDDLPSRVRFIPKPWLPADVLGFVRGAAVRH
ncbi:response regulator [Lichenihabitans sp. Uapishka_5]|uniref:response regulator n=1 Tax=Lichenihabitans sp. Uapishka_5 TaxID=3037302 RepID=UPI0029E813DC|nr:response regulator [Lichenihabitans sp. Uapishka_5]MDX7951114.1 response regulator [Lichenihabitans sp. Uapishka_5]